MVREPWLFTLLFIEKDVELMKLGGCGIVLGLLSLLSGCGGTDLGTIAIHPTQEHNSASGSLYTPFTQSLLRTHSWMDEVRQIHLNTDRSDNATILLKDKESDAYLKVTNLPLSYLVPRLHYQPANPPDDFDVLNLVLAEFSRNSISVPLGSPGDKMAHYQTNLQETVPWKLKGDYDFVPNEYYRPLRVGVINNCLKAGLWEVNAMDRSGEVYHAWFTMPEDFYYDLVARVNGLKSEFIREALEWQENEVKIDLYRLREEITRLGLVGITLKDEEVGFSSQGSRRKIQRDYAMFENSGRLYPPRYLSDFHKYPVAMSSFIEPGIYSAKKEDRSKFDFSFLASPKSAEVKIVRPKTSYKKYDGTPSSKRTVDETYIEIIIDLGRDEKMIIGNLPLHLLVKQEDFVIHGFGVGILHAVGLAERRKYLIERGPHPSYAYLVEQKGSDLFGLNSHGRGIEQIFIRSHPDDATPHWEITITSYERIVDLIKYKVDMPKSLHNIQKKHSKKYIPPVYFSYRDDNIN